MPQSSNEKHAIFFSFNLQSLCDCAKLSNQTTSTLTTLDLQLTQCRNEISLLSKQRKCLVFIFLPFSTYKTLQMKMCCNLYIHT